MLSLVNRDSPRDVETEAFPSGAWERAHSHPNSQAFVASVTFCSASSRLSTLEFLTEANEGNEGMARNASNP